MTEIVNILVVDDDDVTAETVRRSLSKVGSNFRVVEAVDGREGLDILKGCSDKRLSRPYITLLDLNMPRMNGFEFLEAVRSDPTLASSVIFVLSTSDSDADRTRAYKDQVAGYMLKSAIGPQMVRLTALLHDYAQSVRLPL
ncbi:CheY-like chemotaxis protein [Novosphingobium sp. SG751A]|uniref:response regulator n=1 Tax=Novosphingobium sp. SG751A TaxID=2587000 RepID=UPI001555C7AA|nr:response regulator [Novosphingobium sp. SG751A]NOW44490.1 CheY-like chemotaxis protein [Novosphingobium sp. SG751A]